MRFVANVREACGCWKFYFMNCCPDILTEIPLFLHVCPPFKVSLVGKYDTCYEKFRFFAFFCLPSPPESCVFEVWQYSVTYPGEDPIL